MVTSTSEKVRENRLRAMAERQGLALHKSRRRDPRAIDFDRWMVVDSFTNDVLTGTEVTGRQNMDLDQVEAFLTEDRPMAELKRAAWAYHESRGAEDEQLRRLVPEVTKAGMSPEAVAGVTELSLEQITALNSEAREGK
jgi:hypothetical protein